MFPAMGQPPYDTVNDLLPVGMIGTSAQVLVVDPAPVKTVKEFVDYVKARRVRSPMPEVAELEA